MPNDRHSGKLQSRSPSGDPGTQANLKSQAMEMIDSIRLAWRSWVSVGVLAVLCGFLAILQYRWIGEVSRAEHERLEGSLHASLLRVSEDFDAEIRSLTSAISMEFSSQDEAAREREPKPEDDRPARC